MVTDGQLSRERTHQLNLTLYELKQQFEVEVIRGESAPTEKQILDLMKQYINNNSLFDLILVPLNFYEKWQGIEKTLGIDRLKGPTYAGYFCEPLSLNHWATSSPFKRKILLDFCHCTLAEQLNWVRLLISEQQRSGILPWLPTGNPIYLENLDSHERADASLGNRLDRICQLPEIAQTSWKSRIPGIQILVSALWNLASPSNSANPANQPRAQLQIAVHSQAVIFRLGFTPSTLLFPKGLAPEGLVQLFSPNSYPPSHPSQILLRFGDFLRVHSIESSSELEIVVGLLASAPAEKALDPLHTLWIEPIAKELFTEALYAKLSPDRPDLKPLPPLPRSTTHLNLVESDKIQDLQKRVKEKEDQIKELKEGGIGNPTVIEPPEAEALLEGFQVRYHDAKYQIRQFELDLEKIEKSGGTPEEIQALRLKMEALKNREAAWIRKLMATLALFKPPS